MFCIDRLHSPNVISLCWYCTFVRDSATPVVWMKWSILCRRWFVIYNNQLVYRKRSKDVMTVMEDDLRLCTVKPSYELDRRFCFDVLSPTRFVFVIVICILCLVFSSVVWQLIVWVCATYFSLTQRWSLFICILFVGDSGLASLLKDSTLTVAMTCDVAPCLNRHAVRNY